MEEIILAEISSSLARIADVIAPKPSTQPPEIRLRCVVAGSKLDKVGDDECVVYTLEEAPGPRNEKCNPGPFTLRFDAANDPKWHAKQEFVLSIVSKKHSP